MYCFSQGTLSLACRNNDSQVTTLQEEDELLFDLMVVATAVQATPAHACKMASG